MPKFRQIDRADRGDAELCAVPRSPFWRCFSEVALALSFILLGTLIIHSALLWWPAAAVCARRAELSIPLICQ